MNTPQAPQEASQALSGNRRSHRGFTLVEVTIASAIMCTILFSVFMLFRSGTQVLTVAGVQSQLEGSVRRVVDNIAQTVMDSSISTIQESGASMTIPYSTSTFTFKKCTGYDTTTHTFTYGNLNRFALENGKVVYRENYNTGSEVMTVLAEGVSTYLEREKTTADGTDNNANGLIDEAGLCFTLAQNKLTIYLTLQKTVTVAATQQLFQVTANTTVTLRNK